MAKAPRGARAPAPKPAPTPSAAPAEPASIEPVDPVEPATAMEINAPDLLITEEAVTDQVNAALETITMEQLDMSAAASAIVDQDKVWLEMTTGMAGPHLSLSPRDKHAFEAPEAQRLVDAGFAEYTDAPEA
jgi:PBP1b-binding outer membrane lipoprotein LpoB